MPRQALIYDAHEYTPQADFVCSDKDHPEHDTDAAPEDHVQHAPCSECGSGKDAFIHSEEAAETSYILAVAVDEQVAAKEKASAG